MKPRRFFGFRVTRHKWLNNYLAMYFKRYFLFFQINSSFDSSHEKCIILVLAILTTDIAFQTHSVTELQGRYLRNPFTFIVLATYIANKQRDLNK